MSLIGSFNIQVETLLLTQKQGNILGVDIISAFEREKATRKRFSQVLTTFRQFQNLRNFHRFANFQDNDFENALHEKL